MADIMPMKVDPGGSRQSWIWDYYSIKDDAISMSICDICGKDQRHRKQIDDSIKMRIHLSTNHTDIYNKIINKVHIHWESHFERVQCSTDSIYGNIKCKHCNEYNDILLRICKGRTMESHLEVNHNVTKKDWNYLRDWRDKNTTAYYDLTQEPTESIKRTRLCKQCRHQFRRSNLCIMIKHLIQVHNRLPDVSLEKLPKELLELNYPIVDASTNEQPSISGRSDTLEEAAKNLMEELASFMDNISRDEND